MKINDLPNLSPQQLEYKGNWPSWRMKWILSTTAAAVILWVLGYDYPMQSMSEAEITERTFILAFKKDPRSDLLSQISTINGETCTPIDVTSEPLWYDCETIRWEFYHVSGNNIYELYSFLKGRLVIKNPFSQTLATDYK